MLSFNQFELDNKDQLIAKYFIFEDKKEILSFFVDFKDRSSLSYVRYYFFLKK
jgi:hypothetical protein